MDKRILSVYINLQDKKFDLPSYLHDMKFIISICPYSIIGKTFSNDGIEEVKRMLKQECLLGQRGYIGRCKYPHKDGTDPWHENFCLYNPPINLEGHLKSMSKGREVLTKAFGFEPIVYAPINHLYDDYTLVAAQILKYGFMMDQNNFGINPYERHSIVVIPESKIGDKETANSLGVYSPLDKLNDEKVSKFIKGVKLVLPSEVRLEKAPQKILTLNEIQKRIKKLERDKKFLEETQI